MITDSKILFGTPRQFKETTNLSDHYIRQLIAEGKMPGFYVGSAFKINFPAALQMLNDMSEVSR